MSLCLITGLTPSGQLQADPHAAPPSEELLLFLAEMVEVDDEWISAVDLEQAQEQQGEQQQPAGEKDDE